MKKKRQRYRSMQIVAGLCLLLGSALTHAQNNFTISGNVTDKMNGETLFGTSIFLKGTTIGAITNEYGFYSISAPQGPYTLVFFAHGL